MKLLLHDAGAVTLRAMDTHQAPTGQNIPTVLVQCRTHRPAMSMRRVGKIEDQYTNEPFLRDQIPLEQHGTEATPRAGSALVLTP